MSISLNMPTWLDATKAGLERDIVELLAQLNESQRYWVWIPSSEEDGSHKEVIRTGLPDVAIRRLNRGAPVSKAESAELSFDYLAHEVWAEIDIKLVPAGDRAARFRARQSIAFLEAMGQSIMRAKLYGSAGEMVGLVSYYGSLTAANKDNVIDGGGTGSDNTSIWLLVLSENGIFSTYPQGTQGGIKHTDYGVKVITDADKRLEVFQDVYGCDHGLVVKDWRQGVRICNIDVSNLRAMNANADLPTLMIRATERVYNLGLGRPIWMMNRTCREALKVIARNDVKTSGMLNYDNIDGRRIMSWEGIPICTVDQITNFEAVVA